jgi:hypothetical protein
MGLFIAAAAVIVGTIAAVKNHLEASSRAAEEASQAA